MWSSVTLLVVIGGLQHHGNIRKKAAERAVGNAARRVARAWADPAADPDRLALLTYRADVGHRGVCAWFAIGKPGYIALLTAITM